MTTASTPPGRPAGRPTIRDVSRIAGVSIKTVSRVINNEQYVSAAKRESVMRVMAEIGFRPNEAARALAGHRSRQIALICDNPNPWYVYEVQAGLRERCREDDVRMIAQPYDRASPTLLDEIIALIDRTHPDGLVLTPPVCDDARLIAELDRRAIPFVRLQPGLADEARPAVLIDNRQAAADMTGHLLALGHRRIGFVMGESSYASSAQRLGGYRDALAAGGIAPDEALVRQGRFDFTSGRAAAETLLDLPDPPTAIFAASDDMAAGVLVAAHRRGIAVPRDLSVAGFDDAPLAQVVWPPLTTIRQPMRALAAAAADVLLGGGEAADRRLPHMLVLRESTAPPRIA